jgi:hypothetical protein
MQAKRASSNPSAARVFLEVCFVDLLAVMTDAAAPDNGRKVTVERLNCRKLNALHGCC